MCTHNLCFRAKIRKISLAGTVRLLVQDPSKAAGPDTIKPLLLRSLKYQVAPILQNLITFQQTLHTGQIPSNWQKAIETPHFKQGDNCDLGNYRPISLRPSLKNFLFAVMRPTRHFTPDSKKILMEKLKHFFVFVEVACVLVFQSGPVCSVTFLKRPVYCLPQSLH